MNVKNTHAHICNLFILHFHHEFNNYRYDETLVPLDFQQNGQIRDDDLLKTLVIPMQKGVFVTSIMDCCHSGTVLDLPYTFKADGENAGEGMQHDANFNFGPMINVLGQVQGGDYMGAAVSAVSACCVIS